MSIENTRWLALVAEALRTENVVVYEGDPIKVSLVKNLLAIEHTSVAAGTKKIYHFGVNRATGTVQSMGTHCVDVSEDLNYMKRHLGWSETAISSFVGFSKAMLKRLMKKD